MNAKQVQERDRRVANAARAWHEGGMLTPEELQAVLDRYPGGGTPDSIHLTGAFFMFASVYSLFLLAGLFVLLLPLMNRLEPGIPCLLTGLALCLHGDRLHPRPDAANEGETVAVQLWGTGALIAGLTFLARTPTVLHAGLFGLAVFSLAAWRWERGLFAFLAAASLFWTVHLAFGHPLAWVLAGTALTLGGWFFLVDRRGVSTSRWECGHYLLGIALPAIYLAVNRYAVDSRWLFAPAGTAALPTLPATPPGFPEALYALFASAATALYPLVLIAWGLRSRFPTVLNIGLGCLVMSLATLYVYAPLAPLWTVLLFGGLILARLAWALHVWLDRRPDREWRGFTTGSLGENSLRDEGLKRASKFLGKKLAGQ